MTGKIKKDILLQVVISHNSRRINFCLGKLLMITLNWRNKMNENEKQEIQCKIVSLVLKVDDVDILDDVSKIVEIQKEQIQKGQIRYKEERYLTMKR